MEAKAEAGVTKKTRKFKRKTMAAMRYKKFNKKYSHSLLGLTPSRFVRCFKMQTERIKNGEKHPKIYLENLDKVARVSKRSSELTASVIEKELSVIFDRLKMLAKHAKRITVKKEDFDLYLQERNSR